MELVIIVKKSEKSGKLFRVIAARRGDFCVYLSFDTLTILRLTGISLNDLENLNVGVYTLQELYETFTSL